MKKYEEEALCSREKRDEKWTDRQTDQNNNNEGKKAIESKIVTLVLLLLLYNK